MRSHSLGGASCVVAYKQTNKQTNKSKPITRRRTVFTQAGCKLGRQRSGTVSWVLGDQSEVHNPLSPVSKLGIRHPSKKERMLWRESGLSVRDCAGTPNDCGLKWPKLGAIHVTVIDICERLMLVSGWQSVAVAKSASMPSAPSFPPLTLQLFLEFPVFSCTHFPGVASPKCDLLGPCGNLAGSRYPGVVLLFVAFVCIRTTLDPLRECPPQPGACGLPHYCRAPPGYPITALPITALPITALLITALAMTATHCNTLQHH